MRRRNDKGKILLSRVWTLTQSPLCCGPHLYSPGAQFILFLSDVREHRLGGQKRSALNFPSLKVATASIVLALHALPWGYVDGSSLNLVVAMPSGPFAGTNPGQGSAKFGIGAGFNNTWQSPWNGIGFIADISCAINPIDDAKIKAGLPAGTQVDLGYWVNAPLLAGAKYLIDWDPVDFYAVGEAGVNVALQTDARIANERRESETAFSLGLGGGVGMIFNEKVDLGFRYLYLGEPNYKGTAPGIASLFTSGKQKPVVLAFTLGLHVK